MLLIYIKQAQLDLSNHINEVTMCLALIHRNFLTLKLKY